MNYASLITSEHSLCDEISLFGEDVTFGAAMSKSWMKHIQLNNTY